MAKKGSVLAVDDEEIMRDVLETVLSAEGYRVDLALYLLDATADSSPALRTTRDRSARSTAVARE